MSIDTSVSAVRSAAELLGAGPARLRLPDARRSIREANERAGRRIVILDDDPTGTQSVHGVPVLTRWSADDIRWAFQQSSRGFFILTNTRGLDDDEARLIVTSVAAVIAEIAHERGERYDVITRSDSTLRGHFPLETDVLSDLAREAGGSYDAVLLAPAYLAAGRVTVDDVHYVADGSSFVPVGTTNYAQDATFGFSHSNLRDYIAEKTAASAAPILAADVVSLSLEAIREGGPSAVRRTLNSCVDSTMVVVNATDESDLDVVVLGLIEAEAAGTRVLCRTGPSFVAARLGLEDRAPLTRAQIFARGDRPGHGLVVVGSHVALTTAQVATLRAQVSDIAVVEVNVPALLDSVRFDDEMQRCRSELIAALAHSDVLLVSSRDQVVGTDGHSSLVIAQAVSQALVALTALAVESAPLAWVIAKGGITSSDVATEGLGIRRATVAGQLFDGIVSVWVIEADDSGDHNLDGLPYVVFAGNVGTDHTLADAVQILRAPAHSS